MSGVMRAIVLQHQRPDNPGMTIIARIIFLIVVWTVVYLLVEPTPLPSYIEPWGGELTVRRIVGQVC